MAVSGLRAEHPSSDPWFESEVWNKVGERHCLKCHRERGDAADSRLLLEDPARFPARRREVLVGNLDAFLRMARLETAGRSRLLLKVIGGLEHGGERVLAEDSPGYRILERFVARMKEGTTRPAVAMADAVDLDPDRFLAGTLRLSPARLLRRVTLSLAGRLPSASETAAVEAGGIAALGGVLDAVMREEAFLERLAEGFNDIFLTRGYDGVAENALSYDHFNKTRNWYQKHDLSAVGDAKAQRQARYKLADNYREAMLREPTELIKHIVRNDRPFTELVTADFLMVSPYTARGYGIFEEVKGRFRNPDDPFEYVPTRLRALTSRNGRVQESATGHYPHAGMLSLFQYLRRYPSTETNRNRQRARVYFRHFLGVDIMAPQVADAAAVDAKYEIPTMQASECVVCHQTIDPIAGLFQDFFNEDGYYQPRKGGWFTDMFGPGREGEELPETERWRALQWLGERTARDPRFATAMVEHVYYLLFGRPVPPAPEDIEDPFYEHRRRAHDVRRAEVQRIADRLVAEGFNLKAAFKGWIGSPLYQVDALGAGRKLTKARRSELDDICVVHLLTPEQLERKIAALFGKDWGRLVGRESFQILYGGIDSKEVTERMTEPSGAMGAIQRILANEIACRNVALEFSRPRSERRLFPEIEPGDRPGIDAETDRRLLHAVAHLHEFLLGRDPAEDDPEVRRTFRLFADILETAGGQGRYEQREIYFCRGGDDQRLDDPHYTIRAWRAVVTYLLRQYDFLYE